MSEALWSRLNERYEVLRELGRGGMGCVYEARSRETGARLVIKTLIDGDPEGEARFQREAVALAQLRHPHIVRVHDYQRLPRGEAFLVMELLEGEDLGERIEARRGADGRPELELEALLEWSRQLADALRSCHARGILHRDVKPANVMLARRAGFEAEFAVLVDFGVARWAPEAKGMSLAEALTTSGVIVGTPAFMAPEQILESSSQLTGACDVWGFGATLLYALCGEHLYPQAGNLTQLMRVMVDGPPQPPSRRGLELPPALEALIVRCLRIDPTERPTMDEVCEAIGDLDAAPPPRSQRRLMGILVAALGLALVGFGLIQQLSEPPRFALLDWPATAGEPRFELRGGVTGRPEVIVVEAARGGERWQGEPGGDGRFSIEVALRPGVNAFTVYAGAPEDSPAERRVIEVRCDLAPPQLRLEPVPKRTLARSIELRGRVSEPVTLRFAGRELQVEDELSLDWELAPGRNSAELTLEDAAGHMLRVPVETLRQERFVVEPDGAGRPGTTWTLREALKRADDGARIEVAPGTYSGSLRLDRPVEIIAMGEVVLDVPQGEVLEINADDVRLVGLHVSRTFGAKFEREVPMMVARGGGLRMERCTIQNGIGEGLSLEGREELGERSFEDCVWRGCFGDALTVGGGEVALRGCRFVGCAMTGLDLRGTAKALVERVEIQDCFRGIKVYDSASLTASEVTIAATGVEGLYMTGGAQVEMRGCRLEGNGKTAKSLAQPVLPGIWMRGGRLTLESCEVIGSRESGVFIEGGELVARGGSIRGHGGYGVAATEAARVSLTGVWLTENRRGPRGPAER